MISTSSHKSTLKDTLSAIITDKTLSKSNMVIRDCMDMKMQRDYWEDDQEFAGPPLASQKPEGASVAISTAVEGTTWRYIVRTYAVGLVISEEMIEDNKFPKAISAAKDCVSALVRTADIDGTNVWARGFNTAYIYGDGQPLFSSSHPLPHGGTFSNQFATPLPPSVAAVEQARIQARKMPGYHGIAVGYGLKGIHCPIEQESEWERVLNSKLDTDDANNFSRLNVASRMKGMKVVINKYWDDTTTRYAFMTEAEHGPQIRFKVDPQSRSHDGKDQHTVVFQARARWATGTSNPRAVIGVNA